MASGHSEIILHDGLAFIVFTCALLVLVALGEILRVYVKWAPDSTRRLIHIGTGLLVAASPLIFSYPHLLLLLAVLFAVANGISLRKAWFRSMHEVRQDSWGTITFPLALAVALPLTWFADPGRIFAYQVGFLILAVSDPFAAYAGRKYGRKSILQIRGNEKTIEGSGVFAVSAFFVSAVALGGLAAGGVIDWTSDAILIVSFALSLVTAAAELLGSRGWDNLLIVTGAVILLIHLHEHPADLERVNLWLGVSIAFGFGAWKLQALDLSGAVAGGLLALSLLLFGGAAWAVPAFTFFILSSLLTRAGRRRKAYRELLDEKGSRRDAGQVFANGGVGWILLLTYVAYPFDILYWAFVCSFAAATADTWATETGTYFRGATRSVLTGRSVSPGSSGGISVAGTVGAALGGIVIWGSVAAAAWDEIQAIGFVSSLLLVAGSGIVGCFVDSIAGATIQGQYRNESGHVTERRFSARTENRLIHGRPWVTNDRVNLLATAVGAVIPIGVLPGM